MKKTWDGGPAFPQERTLDCGSIEECEGLSMRDYFAAKALAGLCSRPDIEDSIEDKNDQMAWLLLAEYIAEMAYGYADAMVRERKEWYD